MASQAAVVGFPVKHSLSPAIHNAGYKALGLDWEYGTVEISPGNFEEDIRSLIARGYKGVNVTMPFKQEAFEISDKTEGVASKIQTVNTLVFGQDIIVGHNTDAEGFLMSLVENCITVPDLKVMVIGAGGASKAICAALVKAGANVGVTARNIEKSKEIAHISADPSGGKIDAVDFEFRNQAIQNVDLIVNATPVGMTKDGVQDLSCPIDVKVLNPLQSVVDTIYHPRETTLLKHAKEIGCNTYNGTEMLLYQAVLAFNLMTGLEAPIETMKKALLEQI